MKKKTPSSEDWKGGLHRRGRTVRNLKARRARTRPFFYLFFFVKESKRKQPALVGRSVCSLSLSLSLLSLAGAMRVRVCVCP